MSLFIRISLAALLNLGVTMTALAATLTGLDITQSADITQVVLEMDDEVKGAKVFRLSPTDHRVVIDLKDTKIAVTGEAAGSGQQKRIGFGAVKQARFAKRGKTGARIVVDMEVGADFISHTIIGSTVIVQVRGENSIVPVTVELDPGVTAIPETTITPDPTPTRITMPATRSAAMVDGIPIPRMKPRAISKATRLPIIVIDPGHGGYDPGAIGSAGTKEKDITSKAAKELQKQLLATKRYQVLLTRSKDVYVDHDERLRIARAGNADLFISIHADSVGRSNVRGASVYTLADRAVGRSKNIVNSQNWIMDVDLAEESDAVGDILVDLAQRSTRSNSGGFADALLPEIRKVSKMVNNSHRQAGYFVLLAPDVPAVLLEMGFLSNASDEANLITESHRRKLMKAVVKGIDAYFTTERRALLGG